MVQHTWIRRVAEFSLTLEISKMTDDTLPIYFKHWTAMLRESIRNVGSLPHGTAGRNAEAGIRALRDYTVMTPDLTRVMAEVQETTNDLESVSRGPFSVGEDRAVKFGAARAKVDGKLDQLAVLLAKAIPSAKARAFIPSVT
jgi:hypothetical protein